MEGINTVLVPDLWLPLECSASMMLRVSIALALERQLGGPDSHDPAEYKSVSSSRMPDKHHHKHGLGMEWAPECVKVHQQHKCDGRIIHSAVGLSLIWV